MADTQNAAASKAKKTKKVLRISALPEKGFWRAGTKFTREPTDHSIEKFAKMKLRDGRTGLEALKEEPNLRVQEVEVPDEE